MAKMTDDALLAMVNARIAASVNFTETTFSQSRVEALRFYRGEPMGDEEPGLSQVVSRDFMEAVEGALPGLMRPFVSSDEVVKFAPKGDEDEAVADQVTAYINYLFTTRNEAFRFIYDTMKDGLMFRLGVAKVVREEYEDSSEATYQGLDEMSLQALATNPDIEIVAVYDDPDMPGMAAAVTRTAKTKGKICFVPVPNDEFMFERQLANLNDATFLAHRTRKTVADLIDMGLDAKACLALPTGDGAFTLERSERFGDMAMTWGDESPDPMMRYVWVQECYVRCDYSGGQKETEWRRVIVANSTMLANEPADGHPFAAWTPIPIPHRLAGMSYFDITRDLQIIKTQLQREQLNNVYLTNRPQREVVDGQVNVDDLLTPRVGGVIRVKQPGMIRDSVVPFTAGQSGQLIEYFDTVREQRTGVTRYNQGMDADSLNKTATGIGIISNASQQRLELVSRQYAEFLKDIFRLALKLVCKFPDDAEVMRLTNKEAVQVDPRSWADEYDMNVTVGLGTGDKQQQVGMLTNLLQMQQQIVQFQGGVTGPLVGLDNVHETLTRLIEAMGLKGADKYVQKPADEGKAPAQQGPDPAAMAQQAEAAKVAAETAKAQADNDARVAIATLNAESAERIARQNNIVKLMLAGLDEAAAEAAVDEMPAGEMEPEAAEAPEYAMAEEMAGYDLPPQGFELPPEPMADDMMPMDMPQEPPEGFPEGDMGDGAL